MIRTPPYLKKGDLVGIVSPSRKTDRSAIEESFRVLEGWGFRVLEGKHLFAGQDQFAGTDEQRAKDVQMMLDRDQVRAIICSRGGYGSVRIVDQLDFSTFKVKPKWIAGFSDITVFHSHLVRKLNVVSLHAEMPVNFGSGDTHPDTLESLRKSLMGESIHYRESQGPYYREGLAEGHLVGGNLSVLYSLSGSVSDVDTQGKILFLEDLDEYLYHVDRMMIAMKRSGKLARLKGLVVGGMTGMRDNAIPFGKTAEEIVAESVRETDFPVVTGFPSGHLNRNLALKLGGRVRLRASAGTTELEFLDP